jgi:ubiquinone/menaquinone biosynthesis C-methylase UbiE
MIMSILGLDRQTKRYVHALIGGESNVESILDAGCGTGAAGISLVEIFPEAKVLFTDINKEMLLKLEGRLAPGHSCLIGILDLSNPDQVTLLDGEKLVINKPTYDIINASANIGYSSDPTKTITTLYDSLKPGGVIINLEMNYSFWGRLMSWLYGYSMLKNEQINQFMECREAKISRKKISIRYFPLNLTRECILIEKPIQSHST